MGTLFTVDRITRAVAKPFIERLHYSHACPGGHTAFFGVFPENDGRLYAVAAYGIGANPGSAAAFARMTGLPVTKRNMVELKRICREGEKGAAVIPMTAFMSSCHDALWRHGFGLHTGGPKRFVISYSDPAHSHDGTLYRAANFKHLGKVPPQRQFKDASGKFVHARKPHNRMTRWNEHHPDLTDLCPMNTSDAVYEMGLKPFRTVPKDRWFLDLGKPPGGQPWDLYENCPCRECKRAANRALMGRD
jgi:hypothetical protein